MNFKLVTITDKILTASIEKDEYIIVSDFPLKKNKDGSVDSENTKLLNNNIPETKTLSEMLINLGDWVVKNYSHKFY